LEQLGLKYIVKRKEENQVKKRILSMLLVLSLLVGILPSSVLAADSSSPFTDVKKSDWFYDEVQYVYAHGLMEGTATNTFSPKVITSRGMLVTILWRLEGQPKVSGTAFTDVASGQWYTDAIQWASANGIVDGYGNGKFGPKTALTREQMATILYRYATYKGYDVTASADLSKFTDAGKISSYATTAMSWANATGLITGMTDTILAPQGSAIRAQAATVLMRFCENVVSGNSSVGSTSNSASGSSHSVDVYAITELDVDTSSGTATATVSAPEDCVLVVRFIEEDVYFSSNYAENKVYINGGNTYAFHVVAAGCDMENVVGQINGNLPEYFVAEAILVDESGNELCDPYSSIAHTQKYAAFKQKTVTDFAEDEIVLNYDSARDNNFGVLADDVKSLTATAVNLDDTTGIYQIQGLSAEISEGDKLLVSTATNNYLFRAKSFRTTDHGVLEVTPAQADDEVYGYSLVDFYQYIKVDMTYSGEAETISSSAESDAQENSTANAQMGAKIINVDKSAESSLAINPISFETDHFSASGKVTGKISASIVMEWDTHLFGKDYMKCDFTYSTDLTTKITIAGKIESDSDALNGKKVTKELSLGKLRIPFGITGLDAFADIKACIEWELSAGLELEGTIKTTHGFKYNTIDGMQKVDKKSSTWIFDAEGNAELSFGPKPSIGIEFLNGVLSCEAEAFLGAKLEGEAVTPIAQGGSSIHACYLCVDGELKSVVTVDVKLKYKITDHLKGTPIDLNIVTIEKPVFDFYISLSNASDSMFGGRLTMGTGSCPNQKYKSTFTAVDSNGQSVSVVISIKDADTGTAVTNVDSGSACYLATGNYVASATIDHTTYKKSFTISDSEKSVKLCADTVTTAQSNLLAERYKELLQQYPESAEYTLYDIDKNGIPELIVIVEGALRKYSIYSFDGSHPISCGEEYLAPYGGLYAYNGNGLIIYDGGIGNLHLEYIILSTLDNNTLNYSRTIKSTEECSYEELRDCLKNYTAISDFYPTNDYTYLYSFR
jgi:hypothetical protein